MSVIQQPRREVSEGAPPPPSLPGLPEELLLYIVSSLHSTRSELPQSVAFQDKQKERARQRENHLRQTTLRALSLSSRSLNRIATPILYSSFLGTTTLHGITPLRLFYRTVGEKDELVSHVQYVENRLSDYLGNDLSEDTTRPETYDIVNEYFYTLACIIRRARNIVSLSIVSVEGTYLSLWEHLNPLDERLEQTASPCFPKLETLAVQTNVGVSHPCQATFRSICSYLTSAPMLSQLFAAGAVRDVNMDIGGQFTHLRRVDVVDCTLPMAHVDALLLACNGLQHFGCHWAFLQCFADNSLPSLIKHRDTLETLRLDMTEVRFQHPERVAAFRDLRDLKALREATLCHVCLGMDVFQRAHEPSPQVVDLLPQSLERLIMMFQVDDTIFDDMAKLYGLAKYCTERCPKLQEVVLQYTHGLQLELELMGEFQKAGVQLSLREVPYASHGF